MGVEDGIKWQAEKYSQFTLSMDELKSSREGYLTAKKEFEEPKQDMYSADEVRTWLISRDVYLYAYYTTYKNAGIELESVDDYIKDSHEYLMGRKQYKKK